MEVGVGSFSDPEGLEGLAHFLGEFTSLFLSLPLLAVARRPSRSRERAIGSASSRARDLTIGFLEREF